MTSWLFIILIMVCAGGYMLYHKRRPDGMRLPRWFTPKGETLIGKLEAETVKARENAERLQKVLDAKEELARARAENIRLRKEIDGVNERTVGKENETPPVKPPRQKY